MWNLIALGLVIVATLILIAGVLYYGQNTSAQTRATETIADVNLVVSKTDTLFLSNPGGYSAVSTAGLIADRVIPKSMQSTSSLTGAVDVWGGAFGVNPTDQMTGATDAYTVWLSGVPTVACEDILTHFETTAETLWVDNQDLAGTALPLNPDTLGSLCSQTGEGPGAGNVIALAFN